MKTIFYYSLLLVGAIVRFQPVNSKSPISRIDDLPTNVKPIKYNAQIIIDLKNDEAPFMGNVYITIECVENTNEIILNVRDLKVLSQVGLTEKDSSQPNIVKSQYYKPTKDQYVIIFADELKTGRMYDLHIPFKKADLIDFSDRGYTQYDYREDPDDPDEPEKIIALTKADINDARRFLPCMDQIGLKAMFKLRLTVPENMTAFSSVTLKEFSRHYEKKTNTWTATFEFENLIPISTYHLAIVVASLTPVDQKESSTGPSVNIYSAAAVANKIDFTTNTIFHAFIYYLDYFKWDSTLTSSVEALSVLILPKCHEMKTEKHGLIMLDEEAVYLTKTLDFDKKTDIALHLCHAMCRQWIGVRATMLEWNEYWVQMALATFLRGSCLEKIFPDNNSDLLKWELVESYIHVLKIDGQSVSRPVHVPKDDFDLTEAFTDSVLIEKANHLIRMMHFFMGAKFRDGVRNYYFNYRSLNSSLDQVWQVFEYARPKKALWPPENVTIKTVMDSWTTKKGYPQVTVERDYKTNSAKLTQDRFLQLGEEDLLLKTETVLKDSLWIIPLRYITQTELMQNKDIWLPVNLWLTDAEVTIPDLGNELLLIDLGLNVLCRVKYEPDDWRRIHDILRDENNYSKIHEMSRVNLVSDMFAFAEVDKLPYKTLLSTMMYLPHEVSDYPLMVALNEFNKIRSTLFGSEVLEQYDRYMTEILTPIFEKDRFVRIQESSKFDRQGNKLKKLIVETSCNFGVEKCIEQCKVLFQKWIDYQEGGGENPKIPGDFLGIVFCQAIKHGSLNEWSILHAQIIDDGHSVFHDQTTRQAILTGLGCTKRPETLRTYLHWTWTLDSRYDYSTKERLIMFNSLASNENGYQEMKYFINSNFDGLIKEYGSYKDVIGSYLAKLFEVTNTREDFIEIRKLTKSVKDQVRDSEDVLIKSMKMAERNCLWRKMHEETLMKLFQNPIDLGPINTA